jgi:predicted O-methyltransferase YrrM
MLIGSYVRHLFKGLGPHGVHSPFVFKLITEVLVRKEKRVVWSQIEEIRKSYLNNFSLYEAFDFGAGSKKLKKARTVSKAVYSAAMPKWKGEVMHLLVEHVQPNAVIELGTHFGIGTLYLSTAVGYSVQLITIEADPTHIAHARKSFESLHASNITQLEGTFEVELEKAIQMSSSHTLVYVDGNHTEEATLRYFHLLIENENIAVIVFDDIYWSSGMRNAWRTICADKRVQLSLDFYWFGVIFLRGRMKKEHFELRWPR